MHAALAGQGYTLIADEQVAADLWQRLIAKVSQLQTGLGSLTAACWLDEYMLVCCASTGQLALLPFSSCVVHSVLQGAVPLGQQGWQHLRIVAGRPQAGTELTDSVNPLEAKLYHAVHVNKGAALNATLQALAGR